ncbi:MAG: NAD(P)H-dependent oxidoreductase [Oscillospiraceae bacterium]|nr:NAD(P)H-dependent oxidoreductase [Oscillospiraceae bacterium]MDD3260396.1 flavodoxin [Oscillospiraceae bacterium]
MAHQILIIYYSYSNGNTKRIAEALQKATNAEIMRIETVVPYTGSYDEVVAQGQEEVNSGFQPKIKPLPVNPADYDTVIVGTPTWWYTMAPAVLTFLTANHWQGKTVIPFMTNGGWPGHVIKDMKSACKGAKSAYEKEIQFDSTGGDQMITPAAEVNAWIDSIRSAYCD